MTERETLKAIREGILSGKCSDGNLAWIVNLCDESLAESGSANVGYNAAAMCEALNKIKPIAWSRCAYDICAIAQTALAAPARNCDLKECSSDDGMISAHERFCESWHDDGKTCAECPYNPRSPMMTCREKWLLAPAAERKGEGDGK